jgi:L-asparaginase II
VCCVEALPHGAHRVLFQAGNIDQVFLPRSAVKYVQVLPLIESGACEHFGFSDEERSWP